VNSAVAAGVLAPLAVRYAHWLGLPAAVLPEPELDQGEVMAMQVVLRIERTAPPARTPLLEAAAAAAVAVCLDECSAPGGPWHQAVSAWLAGRIRKVSRRARGAHWDAVRDLPGVTVARGNAQVRALVPGQVAELMPQVSRLQVAGTDLEPDSPGAPPPGCPVLWLNPHVTMTTGKAAAQVGHATMLAAALLHADGLGAELRSWAQRGFEVAVRTSAPEHWQELRRSASDPLAGWRRRRLLAVRDAGFTEVDPGTITVLAEYRPPLG
jgi:peptidyl-tRNA hydrolase